jgi:heme-degrading monooxygenase HmoA
MIMRTWTTGINEARAAEYDAFSLDRSLPMFRSFAGFRALVYTRGDDVRTVVTFWRDIEAIEELERSDRYRETVEAILAAGFLREPQTVALQAVDHIHVSWP